MVRSTTYIVFALLLIMTCLESVAQSAQEISSPTVSLSRSEARLVKAVNAYRHKHGLEPLRVDPSLMHVARHAAPYFSHVIHGKWCWHRTRAAGFHGRATDNIANGHPTPEDAVEGWASSHGHAMQMRGYFNMNRRWQNYRFNRIGVGISGTKYIAVFGHDDQPQQRIEE